MQNLSFKTYNNDNSTIKETWPLTEVKKQLGLSSINLQRSKDGEGWRAIFNKPDGTSTCLPVSKEMTAELFPQSRLALTDKGTYIICRPEGSSTVASI